MHPQDDSAFRFRTQEHRVKTVNFDVGRNHPKLIGYHRARQLYNNISMLFLFPVIDGKLSTGINASFNASCYG